jgi:hypothetical protein
MKVKPAKIIRPNLSLARDEAGRGIVHEPLLTGLPRPKAAQPVVI